MKFVKDPFILNQPNKEMPEFFFQSAIQQNLMQLNVTQCNLRNLIQLVRAYQNPTFPHPIRIKLLSCFLVSCDKDSSHALIYL